MELEKGSQVVMIRDYRKGNWTLEETLVLIEAKKLDEQRRMLKNTTTANTNTDAHSIIKPSGELRWKWIEENCWRKGCFRSQNQCNDKWDNLMGDFKKVREFERKRCYEDNDQQHKNNNNDDNESYWKMDKIQRKNNNLPSNMLPQIYQALAHVVEGRLGVTNLPTIVFHPCTTTTTTTPPPLAVPPPPPPPPPPERDAQLPLPTEESSAKRRNSSEGGRSISEEISASATVLMEAIKGYEEREETRHRELYNLHQKRYKIEESKIELERQGFNELVDAINNLSNSIVAFTSQRTHQ